MNAIDPEEMAGDYVDYVQAHRSEAALAEHVAEQDAEHAHRMREQIDRATGAYGALIVALVMKAADPNETEYVQGLFQGVLDDHFCDQVRLTEAADHKEKS